MSGFEHRAQLPYGYVATFSYAPPSEIAVQWHPSMPTIQNARARRRLLKAYQAARADFLKTVATLVNGNVAAIDLGRSTVESVSFTEPATHQ